MQGAIYATDNAAYTWSAAVQETVDATLNRTVSSGISGASYYEGTFSNIQRSPAGDYVAVSSRGVHHLLAMHALQYNKCNGPLGAMCGLVVRVRPNATKV